MRVRAALLLLALGFALSCALKPTPRAPIRIRGRVSAGGGSDLAARVVAQKLSEGFGQPSSSSRTRRGERERRRGGRRALRTRRLHAGDGQQCQHHHQSASDGPVVRSDEDLAPVAMLTVNPLLLFVNPAVVPVNSFKEFLAYVKERDGKVDYASAGNGSPAHLSGELLQLTAGSAWCTCPTRADRRA